MDNYQLRKKNIHRASNSRKHVIWWFNGKKCARKWCRVTDPKLLTVDHIVPASIALRSGWNKKEINGRENLQLLCQKHHNEKDKDLRSMFQCKNPHHDDCFIDRIPCYSCGMVKVLRPSSNPI